MRQTQQSNSPVRVARVQTLCSTVGSLAEKWCYNLQLTGPVAQLVEQRIENPRVDGSIPSQATKIKTPLVNSSGVFCFLGGIPDAYHVKYELQQSDEQKESRCPVIEQHPKRPVYGVDSWRSRACS